MIDQVQENIQQIEELKRDLREILQALQESNFKSLDTNTLQEIISNENAIDLLIEVTDRHFKDSAKSSSNDSKTKNSDLGIDFLALKKLKNDFETCCNHYRSNIKPLIEKAKKSAPKSLLSNTVFANNSDFFANSDKKKKSTILPTASLFGEDKDLFKTTKEPTNVVPTPASQQNQTNAVQQNQQKPKNEAPTSNKSETLPKKNEISSSSTFNNAQDSKNKKNFISDDDEFKVVFIEEQEKQQQKQQKQATSSINEKKNKKEELKQIEKDLDSMVQISNDINSTLQEHDQKIDKIEGHVENSIENAKQGTMDLKKASLYAMGGVVVAGVAGAGLGAIVGGPIGAGIGLYGGLTSAGALAATLGVGAGVGAVGGTAAGVVGRKIMQYVNTAGVSNILTRKRGNSLKKGNGEEGDDVEISDLLAPSPTTKKAKKEKKEKKEDQESPKKDKHSLDDLSANLTFKSKEKKNNPANETKSMINLPKK